MFRYRALATTGLGALLLWGLWYSSRGRRPPGSAEQLAVKRSSQRNRSFSQGAGELYVVTRLAGLNVRTESLRRGLHFLCIVLWHSSLFWRAAAAGHVNLNRTSRGGLALSGP